MAEIEWSRQITAPSGVGERLLRGMRGRADWEDLLTLAIAMCAVLSVAGTLEGAGWSQDMPPLTLVSLLALPSALMVARSRLPAYLAWPLAALIGAAVLLWQTLVMAGPGSPLERLDAVYTRFDRWFYLAFGAPGVNNDPLPLDVLTLGLTWLGVFLFGWSVFRWNNAWPGLIPGGVALFLDIVFVGDALTTASILYVLFGFLLLMRTNITSRIARWRAEGTPYPSLISFTFLNFSLWALLALIIAGWLTPTGPFSTPAPVKAITSSVQEMATGVVRLAGPLHVKKVTPVHNYTAVLPFQGSVKLGERELLSVWVRDPALEGPIALRGSVYDTYSAGGWQAGARERAPLPARAESLLRKELGDDNVSGMLVPLTVQVRAKSVVGSVIFAPGNPVSAERFLMADMPADSIQSRPAAELGISSDGAQPSDEQVLNQMMPEDLIGLGVNRDPRNNISSVQVFDLNEQPLPDALALHPGARVSPGQFYKVLGFINTSPPDRLRQAGLIYPQWVRDLYLQLPDSMPPDVRKLARDVTGGEKTPYDRAKAIEAYLRGYPVDYKIEGTPPGRDTVQYFLFDARRGYFDYHSSAMVVMLRGLGVPSRLAVGFVVDEADRDQDTGSYLVKDKNTYAWAEVYFPGYGWIPFNPSPDRPADLAPRSRNNTPLIGGAPGEEDFGDGSIVADRVLAPFTQDGIPAAGSSGASGGRYIPWALLAVLAFAAAMAFAVGTGWQRAVAGLPYSQQLWEKTVRLASWAGYPPGPGQTPQEYARRLEETFWVRDVSLLASVYSRSRFGKREVEPQERERLEQMWPRLRSAALSAMLRRFGRRWG